jgi:hypothetical protein
MVIAGKAELVVISMGNSSKVRSRMPLYGRSSMGVEGEESEGRDFDQRHVGQVVPKR